MFPDTAVTRAMNSTKRYLKTPSGKISIPGTLVGVAKISPSSTKTSQQIQTQKNRLDSINKQVETLEGVARNWSNLSNISSLSWYFMSAIKDGDKTKLNENIEEAFKNKNLKTFLLESQTENKLNRNIVDEIVNNTHELTKSILTNGIMPDIEPVIDAINQDKLIKVIGKFNDITKNKYDSIFKADISISTIKKAINKEFDLSDEERKTLIQLVVPSKLDNLHSVANKIGVAKEIIDEFKLKAGIKDESVKVKTIPADNSWNGSVKARRVSSKKLPQSFSQRSLTNQVIKFIFLTLFFVVTNSEVHPHQV